MNHKCQCGNKWFVHPTRCTKDGLPILTDENHALCVTCNILYRAKLSRDKFGNVTGEWIKVDKIEYLQE